MLSITVSSLFLTVIILLHLYFYLNAKKRPKNFPPGPSRLPIWGSYWFLLKENYNFAHLALESLGKQYKTDIMGLFLGDYPTVVTFSNELCKELLTREEFTGRNDTIIIRARSLGEPRGIFFIDGPFWKGQRRFSLRHLRDFGFGRRSNVMESFMESEIKYLINVLSNEPRLKEKDFCREKGQVLVPDLFYGTLLNSILTILTSTRFDNFQLREIGRKALKFQRSGDATGAAISFTPWLRYLAPTYFGYTAAVENNDFILKFLEEIIDEHIKTFSDDHHRDFIDIYLSESTKDGNSLDYRQLLLTVLDYMFPSAIAIGHTLSFYFFYLKNYTNVQIKVQNEIDKVVGRSRLPDLDDRKSMPYLEATIREVIRIFPLNPLGLPRRCIQDTYLGGYFVPKDTIMLPCVWTAHHDEKVWKNPEEFKPERFLDESGNLLKKDFTMGFGAGKRLCAGETFARQNMFLIISGILQNFTITSLSGKQEVMDVVPGVNLSLKENWIKAISR